VRAKSYTEAVRLANAAGIDAAKKRMRKAGRTVMSAADRDHAVDVIERILTDLGFDIVKWQALAGVPRNEPDEPVRAKRPKRRSKAASVQLSFAFA
jgi:polysaccharide deacetylase 2 family uncharacterized protein YibQ